MSVTTYNFQVELGIDVVGEQELTPKQRQDIGQKLQKLLSDYDDHLREHLYSFIVEDYDFSDIADELYVDGIYSWRAQDVMEVVNE